METSDRLIQTTRAGLHFDGNGINWLCFAAKRQISFDIGYFKLKPIITRNTTR